MRYKCLFKGMSIFDTERILTEESIKSYGFVKRAHRGDYMWFKYIDGNKISGCKIMYLDIQTRILTKIIDLPDKRITREVKIDDIDDLTIHINKW